MGLESLNLSLPKIGKHTQQVHCFVRAVRLCFPGRILSIYVVGSHASGQDIESSDLDIIIVFRYKVWTHEFKKHEELRELFQNRKLLRIDATLISYTNLVEKGSELIKLNSTLLYGQDLEALVPFPDMKHYKKITCTAAIRSIFNIRNKRNYLKLPIEFPSVETPFLGYVHERAIDPKGVDLRAACNLIADICKAEIAVKLNRYVGIKSQNIHIFSNEIDQDIGSKISPLYFLCRDQLHYSTKSSEDKQHAFALEELISEILTLEKFYISTLAGESFILDGYHITKKSITRG